MLAGHAIYAKGVVEETVGNVTGSAAWKEAGQRDAQAGISEMKVSRKRLDLHLQQPFDHSKRNISSNLTQDANQIRSEGSTQPGSAVGGKLEETAGKVVGCGGMEKEGAEKQQRA